MKQHSLTTMHTKLPMAILCSSLLFCAPTYSAESEMQLSIEKGEAVKITGIDDWFFGVYSATDKWKKSQRFRDDTCVHSSTGVYKLTVNSANGDKRPQMVNSAGDKIFYNIIVRAKRVNNRNYRARIRTATFTKANLKGSTDINCTNVKNNSNLRFLPIVTKRAFNKAPPGTYNDLITIVVSPL